MSPERLPLPVADLERVFSILRFISKQQDSNAVADASSAHGAESVSPALGAGEKTGSTDPLVHSKGVEGALTKFRMAVTNLPIQMDAVEVSRTRLLAALQEAYPNSKAEVAELCGCSTSSELQVCPCDSFFPSRSMSEKQPMHEIVPGLYVGSYHPALQIKVLTCHNITHILSCINIKPHFPMDFVYMTLSAQDSPEYNIKKFFLRAFRFIEKAIIEKRSAVLVHCGAGISRAPTIAASYLIKKLGLTAEAAIAMIKKKRSVASPNMGFRRQLREYQEELSG